jgi:hypothetical protein
MFVVKYRVVGDGTERTTKPYATELLAEEHARDIRGYEGVVYAIVVPWTKSGNAA